MIARYNTLSLSLGLPGIVLQIASAFVPPTADGDPSPLSLIIRLVGTVMLMAGLYYYALAKGRNGAWCLLGLLSFIGLIILGLLSDESGVDE